MSSSDYSDSSDSYSNHHRKHKKSMKPMSKRQQVINNFMNGIIDPEYLCKPDMKKPGKFIVSKRKKPLDIQPANPSPKIETSIQTPTPIESTIKPVESENKKDETNNLLTKYIQNQDSINQTFNNAIMDLKETMIKMDKEKAKRKRREAKKKNMPPKQQQLNQNVQPPSEFSPEPPSVNQVPTYYTPRRFRPRDIINFNAF